MLAILGELQLQEMAAERLQAPPSSADGVAEVLRGEMWARGICLRRSLRDRSEMLLRPIGGPDRVTLDAVLGELIERGDITEGPGGQLATAPLRAVSLGGGLHRLFGTMPTALLRRLLGVSIKAGVSREATLNDLARGQVTALGGLVLSPQRWSGLDRAPVADSGFLDGLDRWLGQSPDPAGVFTSGLAGEWQGYRPGVGPCHDRCWRAGPGSARLWRAWHEHGYFRFAWSAGALPTAGPAIRLSSDDARRACFTLDRVAGIPAIWKFRHDADDVILPLRDRLPLAEYRFLIALGDRAEAAVRIPTASWPQVDVLSGRLGITFIAEGTP